MILFSILSSITFAPAANAVDVASSICEYVASDNKKRLRSFLKSNKLKIRKIFKQLKCNGKNLLVFAAESDSVKTGTLMISKLPKKVVAAEIPNIEGKSQALVEEAKKRVGS